MDSLFLAPDLGRKAFTSIPSCELWGFVDVFYQIENVSFYSWFAENFCFNERIYISSLNAWENLPSKPSESGVLFF